ncbi:hypothetical protein ACFWPU_07505 [Streptomyces sp. NPDC058471]|uniref:hypothetical protein n=1 Tax=Streptomyces sp. NPDC058471 TaxID=3346516 RepID=UPI0036525358
MSAVFFEAGRTYQRRRWHFQCLSIAPSPFDGETRAVGFLYRPGEPDTAYAFDSDDWEHGDWTATEAEPGPETEPTPLRWGLDDVMYGSDDTTTVLLSGPVGEPYWLELGPDRTAALLAALAGPEGLTLYRAQHGSIVMGLYTTATEARAHCVAKERRTRVDSAAPVFSWIENEEDGVASLVTVAEDSKLEAETGYIVTALTAAAEYDAEADE